MLEQGSCHTVVKLKGGGDVLTRDSAHAASRWHNVVRGDAVSISQPYGLLFVVQEAFRLFSLGPTAGAQYTSLLLLGFAAIFIR